MTITLDTIDLPDLVFESEFDTGMRSVVETALDGTPNIWEQSIPGRKIDLVGDAGTAWMQRHVLRSLFDLASVPCAYYTLSYEGAEYTVRFRNEEFPAIEATPLIPRPNAGGDDYYINIRIKLMEI